jgi:hypothetical protein
MSSYSKKFGYSSIVAGVIAILSFVVAFLSADGNGTEELDDLATGGYILLFVFAPAVVIAIILALVALILHIMSLKKSK